MIAYRTLSVRIEALRDDRYKAIVRGPEGDGQAEFQLTFGEQDFDAAAAAVSRPRGVRRRIESDGSAHARDLGERLFELVFRGSARDVLRASLAQARRENEGLRVMLQLDGAQQLRNVPWELLWDSPKFISTSAYTPVLRYVDIPMRPPALDLRPPLRILGMVSSPGDMPALDAEREKTQLTDACRSLSERGLLEIEWVNEASLGGLLRYLNQGDYHIFHFIGHGDFDEQEQDGVLLFEGHAGRSHRVTGVDLGTILADQHTLRLAVINACEGARVALDSNGIAASLMQYGLPAVIAMQFEISDEAAIGFAEHFYEAIARGHPIDEALADARRGMFANGHGLEWATPVLFTSVDDGRLFEFDWEGSDRRGKDHGTLAPWMIATVAAATVAIAVVVLALAGVFAGNPTLSVGDPISVGRTPVGIAAMGNRVWVADQETEMVSSIDPRTHKVDDEVPVAGKPNSVAVGSNGYVWVVSIKSDRVTVFDPRSHLHPDEVLHRYTVGSEPNTIALGFGAAWVGNSGDGTVSRIDLNSGEINTIPGVGGHPSGIAVGLGSVWVASSADRAVARIYPRTEGVKQIPVGLSVSGIAVGQGAVWVTDPLEGRISRILPRGEEGEVAGTISVGREPRGIAVASNGIWVANKRSRTVSWIAPGSSHQQDREIKLGGEPNAIAVGLGAVWVTKLDNSSVTPIKP